MWFNDSKWCEAAEACLRWKHEFDWILTPSEFHGMSHQFRPLEYSEHPPAGRIAFLCHKDFSDNLSTAFRQAAHDASYYLFANEVFVLGCLESGVGEANDALPGHLAAWFNRASGKLLGRRDKPTYHTEFQRNSEGKKALLIGATSFGNTGDDLLGETAARVLLDSGTFGTVHLADFNLRRVDLQDYDEVFIGGGGLLYVSQVGELDWQNLANYFKFPFWCAEVGKPCHLLAVGHQEYGPALEKDGPTRRFLQESLGRFQSMTVRDQETAALIREISGRTSTVGADPVFSFAREVGNTVGVSSESASGVLLVGQLFNFPTLIDWLGSKVGQARLRSARVGFALMSNDDQSHLKRLQALMRDWAINLDVHDFRGIPAQQIIEIMRGYEALVGTRFHGFVLGMLAGVRPVIFDQHGGKKDRLVRAVFPNLVRQLIFSNTSQAEVDAVLSVDSWNRLQRAEPTKVLAHAATVANHQPVDPMAKTASPYRLPEPRRKELAKQLLTEDGRIKLCWAASGPGSNGYANLGDALSAFMIANLAGLPVKHTNFNDETVKMFGVGSIGHLARQGHAVIWGTGCYRPDIMINNVKDTTYEVLASRGNISQQCLESVGIKAPACYGEPVWVLPSMFNEKVEKKYELGIISHISDLKTSGPNAVLKDEWSSFEIPDLLKASITPINTWHKADLKGMLDKLRLILSCKRIASRSFHGVVIAETYGIPCLPICSKPGVPQGVFSTDDVKIALLDRRTVEFFNSGTRRPQYFYGQRRGRATDWEHLIQSIDRVWSPIGYDATPMLEAFPFDLPTDPTTSPVPIHPSMKETVF